MLNTTKNKSAIYLYVFFCFFTTPMSFSQPPAPGGDDVLDNALPIDQWEEILIVPVLLLGMYFIYKKSVPPEPEK